MLLLEDILVEGIVIQICGRITHFEVVFTWQVPSESFWGDKFTFTGDSSCGSREISSRIDRILVKEHSLRARESISTEYVSFRSGCEVYLEQNKTE